MPAIFDEARKYRYVLTRDTMHPTASRQRRVMFIMLNPSTADESEDDPTIRRCRGFAKDWGYGTLVVTNIFALRATDPKQLYQASDPIGKDNDFHIITQGAYCDKVVLAWGNHGNLLERGDRVRQILISKVCYHLGLTKTGQPKHPLYLKRDTTPTR